ncbi:hypothetical protein ACJRO7_004374 [Eucalyptus globulus]|uniref:Uncharacterized protein n=1 Tax=Eucalyptus globulus TaxID=34317 RepID=A0ABD3IZ67_EUCGL
MGRPLTELFAPCSSVHQKMQPEEVSDPSTQTMPLHAMLQSNPQHLVGPRQIPQANQSFGAQLTLYSGQSIPVSSQIPAGFQPLHHVPGFTTGLMNAPAQPFHTADLDYPQVPFHLHNVESPTCVFAAVVACCFPCVTFGQIVEIVDRGSRSCGTSRLLYGGIQFLIGCPCLLSCTCRTKLWNRFNLIKSPAPNCITHFFCECCALSEGYRELKNKGLDPSIGWQGNAANMQNVQHQVVMVPPMHQQAMRA